MNMIMMTVDNLVVIPMMIKIMMMNATMILMKHKKMVNTMMVIMMTFKN